MIRLALPHVASIKQAGSLLDVDASGVRTDAIYREDYALLPSACQTAGQLDVHLIEAREVTLRPGVLYCDEG